MNSFDQPDSDHSPSRFTATRWSVVLAAGQSTGLEREKALQQLAQSYWFPLYSYIRRKGHPADEAEDLTQGFFSHLLEKQTLAKADQDKGRFRAFLLTVLKHYISDEWKKSHTLKRGGQRKFVQMDAQQAEGFYSLAPVDPITPEKLFDRNWAMALLTLVMTRLGEHYAQKGQTDLFIAIKGSIDGSAGDLSYADIGAKLNMTEAAVKTAAHRLRKQYRDILREEIAQTVSSEDEIDDEIRFLMDTL